MPRTTASIWWIVSKSLKLCLPHRFEVVDVLEAGIRPVVVRVEGRTENHVVQYEIMQRFGSRARQDDGQ